MLFAEALDHCIVGVTANSAQHGTVPPFSSHPIIHSFAQESVRGRRYD